VAKVSRNEVNNLSEVIYCHFIDHLIDFAVKIIDLPIYLFQLAIKVI